MTLSPGTRLGPYEVLEPIGAGGMGEVYRARDTTLGRDVAIKVLPDDFAADTERLARFRREAQVLASLNHPNIAAIYGTEQNALILELVEGPTLAERIAEGPIPLEEALKIARQIAEALEAAHQAGVIHRDLKPPNVKVQEDGTVKVLDFGLAKAIEGGEEGDSSESPTLTGAATRAGVIMGTAAYMSPEQAKGKRVDKRADVWAFGVVLYEMLTGQRPFAGEDVSETLAHVLTKEPDWDALPTDLSPTLRTYLIRCLHKDPKQRVPDIGVLRLAMDGAFETAPPSSETPAEVAERRARWPWIGLGLVLGVILGIALWSSRPEAPRPLARFVVNLPSEAPPLLGPPTVDVAITPDGTRIVYTAIVDGRQLVVRGLGELETTHLGGLNTLLPFVSPDGNWVGYVEGSALRKISILGGPPMTILARTPGFVAGASWGPDDTIVFATSVRRSGLWRVSASGGEPEVLTTPDERGNHMWPEFLPGGEAVLFTIFDRSDADAQIAVLSLASGETKVLVPGGSNPRYAPTGHIVYGVGGTLRAVSFDLERLEVTSEPVSVLEGVVTKETGAANFAISQNGSLAYVTGPERVELDRTLVWVDREGREEPIAAEPRAYTYPRISPDGTRLALDVRDQEEDIWIWDFTRETMTRLTFDPGREYYPAWTPDGLRLAFASERDGPTNLYWQAADGTGTVERLSESDNTQFPQMFSPDGKQLIFFELHPETGLDLGVRSMDSDGTSEPLLATEFSETNAEISSNGRWIAYESNASGLAEIYVRPFPDVDGGRWQISTGGGTRPLWRPDGRELFYLSPGGQLMGVPVETDAFAAGNPEVVLEVAYVGSSGIRGGVSFGRTYDISPDGKRFLMIKESGAVDDTEPAQLILVMNWLDELKRLVPVR